jgi:hypothetical protein
MAEGDAGKAEAGSCSAAAASGAGGCDAVKKRPEQSVAFHELFGFADPLDWLLMAAGSAGAVVHGAAMPVFFLLFGELVNGFGKNQHNLRRMTDEVSKARIVRSWLSDPFWLRLLFLYYAAIWLLTDADALKHLLPVFALLRLPRPRRLRLVVPRWVPSRLPPILAGVAAGVMVLKPPCFPAPFARRDRVLDVHGRAAGGRAAEAVPRGRAAAGRGLLRHRRAYRRRRLQRLYRYAPRAGRHWREGDQAKPPLPCPPSPASPPRLA